MAVAKAQKMLWAEPRYPTWTWERAVRGGALEWCLRCTGRENYHQRRQKVPEGRQNTCKAAVTESAQDRKEPLKLHPGQGRAEYVYIQ